MNYQDIFRYTQIKTLNLHKSLLKKISRPRILSLLVAAALLFSASSLHQVRAAAAGALDLSFDSDGKVTTDFFGSHDTIFSIALQADGKIIVAGSATGGTNENFALARYNSDGTLDTTFGIGGKVATDFFGGGDTGYAVVIQSDGKIILAGTAGPADFALVRYNGDGSLDSSFGTGGKVTTDFSGRLDIARAVLIQPDNKIVVGGGTSTPPFGPMDFALARYDSNGALDSTFGTGGKVTSTIAFYSGVTGMALQADGKIVAVGGDPTNFESNSDFATARFNSDGSLDSSFGTGGKVLTNFNTHDLSSAVQIQADGKIVVAGSAGPQILNDVALARYNSDGSLDSGFGVGGKVITVSAGSARALRFQPDGKLIVAGWVNGSFALEFTVLRYLSNGTLDQTFGIGGRVATDIFSNREDRAYAVVLQPDGKIVAAGSTDASGGRNFAIARYIPEATRTPSDFDGDGRTDFAVFRPGDGTWYILQSTAGLKIQQFGSQGDFVVAEDYDGDGKSDIAVWRRGTLAAPQSVFYVLRSSDNSVVAQAWGSVQDLPVPADYDGDGKADFAVIRPGANTGDQNFWYILRSSDGAFVSLVWGIRGDIPQSGDYDGDGKADPTVKRYAGPNYGDPAFFYTLLSSNNELYARQLGINREFEAQGDYDGDTKTDTGVYVWDNDPFNGRGTFYILTAQGNLTVRQWGVFGDFAAPGDYDGDGKTDIAIWRPSDGMFYVLKSSGGTIVQQWGQASDLPTTVYLGN